MSESVKDIGSYEIKKGLPRDKFSCEKNATERVVQKCSVWSSMVVSRKFMITFVGIVDQLLKDPCREHHEKEKRVGWLYMST